MAWRHFKTQFNLSLVGTASGESAADIINDANKRGDGQAGFDEFLAALPTYFSGTATILHVQLTEENRTQIIVGDFAT